MNYFLVGRLSVNGDPSIEKGDIRLSLRERDPPVQVNY